MSSNQGEKQHINTGNSPPISVPPYRMSPVKKEILRKEIEDLLEKDIIDECESPYGAPVVLIPKPKKPVSPVYRLPEVE
ncbi:retrovirus-related Pol polyprotein from transposon 17.6 [Trichonephila clavipes]|nr:retrovirus-related Pol polyprotein from transposon 17.6 [Trichonephila clavipes]